jgi:prophage regulatory protein
MVSSPSRVIRLPEVLNLTGLGRDTVYRLAKAGKFPAPMKISERASGWRLDAVAAYLAKREAESTGAA